MARVTLRALDGADRGRVFANVETPITIGREEGNTIQLNDERVSRFHVKIQEDHDQVVLTDLDSTNGTRVNGEDIQLRNLRFGDVLQVGRTVLVYGTREQIAQRLNTLCMDDAPFKMPERKEGGEADGAPWPDANDLQDMFFCLEPPELPERMSPGQAAQLAELIEYVLIRLRHLLSSVREEKDSTRVTLDVSQWQNLLDLQCRLAEYLRHIGEPNAEDGLP